MIIAGHRGFGCTDHEFYADKRDIQNLPVENTLNSIERAFQSGAKYIETDAVMSNDGVLFTLHNVVPKDHFFTTDQPRDLLNKLNFDDIQKYATGHTHNGQVATLEDVLKITKKYSDPTCPFDINIEIKGVQGSGQNFEQNDYLQKIAETIKDSDTNPERVLFSSFAMENITRMSHIMPHAQYGMLFAERENPRAIYTDHTDDLSFQYIPFTPDYIDQAIALWQSNASKKSILKYLHPEIVTITDACIQKAKSKNMGINCWALFEELTDTRKQKYTDVYTSCQTHGVFLSCITDYCDDMIDLAKSL